MENLEVNSQNQNNDNQWNQVADQASNIIPTAVEFFLINTPGTVDC